ncbi:hypothetical protein KO481_41250 [Nocardia sp. NEAU-G5]|uniref:NERD domain-containing protein n=1 Tax=Nocardia albiluteola TaxID=2842303 RepID=A0ABS6BCR8_9NOCA|nr:hypothetical protein [Nocardia albiluteola]MBU3067928.1 hypothetical protein [Nocardia albiluteola]
MLVKVRGDDPSRLSSTERTVVNWLKSWTGSHALGGIALVRSRAADVIVWTPKTCVVVVVKGFTERVNGTLRCSDTEPWTIDGALAPLEDVDQGTEPMDEIHYRTSELERELRSAPGRESVAVMGIVLIIPQLGTRIALEKGPLPPGIDVVVGDGPSSLRAYFTRIAGDESGAGGPDSWDAAQVGQALGMLGFAAAATYSDLVAEGFGTPSAKRAAAPEPVAAQRAAALPVPEPEPAPPRSAPRPTPPRPRSAPPREFAAAPPPVTPPREFAAARAQSPAGAPESGAAPSYQPTPQPYSVPFDPRPPKAERPPRGNRSIAPLIVLGFLVVVLAVAAMCTGGGGGKRTTPAPGSSQTTLTTPPSFTTAPERTIPTDTNGPACFPLQPCPGS